MQVSPTAPAPARKEYIEERFIQGGFCRQKHSHRNTDSKIGPGGRKAGRESKTNNQKPRKPTETQGRFQTLSDAGPLTGDADEGAGRMLNDLPGPVTGRNKNGTDPLKTHPPRASPECEPKPLSTNEVSPMLLASSHLRRLASSHLRILGWSGGGRFVVFV